WCSNNPLDREFGSLGTFTECHLAGKNIFAFPDPRDSRVVTNNIISRSRVLIASSCPSRVLLLIPKEFNHDFLVIARLQNAPVFGEIHCGCDLVLALAANKESMFRDPVNWSSASARLREWSSQVEIPPLTDALFRERIVPSHRSRASSLNQFSLQKRLTIPVSIAFIDPSRIRSIRNSYLGALFLLR